MILQTDNIPFDQLLGPYGLLVFLILAVYIMGRFLFRYISKLEKERDFWQEKSIQLLETASSAVNSAVQLSPDRNILDMAKVVDEARKRGDIP